MSYDFLGQMFGKARRRTIEAAAQQVLTGGQKPVAVDFGVLATRLAAGVTLAVLKATLDHTLPATSGGVLSVAGAGLIAAGPSALRSSGLLTALSPDTVSAFEGLTRAVRAAAAAPQQKRQAAFQAAVAQEVGAALDRNFEKTGSFTPADLGRADLGRADAAPLSAAQGLLDASNPAETPGSLSTAAVGAGAGTADQRRRSC